MFYNEAGSLDNAGTSHKHCASRSRTEGLVLCVSLTVFVGLTCAGTIDRELSGDRRGPTGIFPPRPRSTILGVTGHDVLGIVRHDNSGELSGVEGSRSTGKLVSHAGDHDELPRHQRSSVQFVGTKYSGRDI